MCARVPCVTRLPPTDPAQECCMRRIRAPALPGASLRAVVCSCRAYSPGRTASRPSQLAACPLPVRLPLSAGPCLTAAPRPLVCSHRTCSSGRT
ncbi:hypothetical protein C8R44DRAFT_795775 [Mycena epipterygia]|nr:hypothetical protein C8R44DRAFT_795775 [Mycena epipterygia]